MLECRSLVQRGRLKICCVRTRGFKSHFKHNVYVAQWIERSTSNREAAGSSPAVDFKIYLIYG